MNGYRLRLKAYHIHPFVSFYQRGLLINTVQKSLEVTVHRLFLRRKSWKRHLMFEPYREIEPIQPVFLPSINMFVFSFCLR